MPSVDHISTFAAAPAGASSPDSITQADGRIWVAYTNGADSTGAFGHSTIVEYSTSGAALHTYQLAGYVDGLKLDPDTGKVWALQNQDGNSTLSVIDPAAFTVDTLHWAVPSSTRGFDDVVFRSGQVFLSYTNPPGTSGDPTLVRLFDPTNLSQPLKVKTVLSDGTLARNTTNGLMQVAPQADPDSLTLAPNGDLIFTSGDDGVIIDVAHPSTPRQSVSFTPIQGVTAGGAGLDDVIKPSATSGTFYIADTKDNRILKLHVTGLNPNDYYASVGSLKAFGQVDPTTGAFTALVSAAHAPGMSFAGPHGVTFVPDVSPAVTSFVQRAASLGAPHAAEIASSHLALAGSAHSTATMLAAGHRAAM